MGSCLSSESRSPLQSPTSAIGRKRKNSKRRPGSRNSSFDLRKEEHLHRIPGRRFLSGSSDVATLFTQQGKKGTNQDAMIVWENFGSRTDTVFCGVFDGHGPYGHMVAKRVRDSLPLKLSALWEVNTKSEDVLIEFSLNTALSMNSESASLLSADEVPMASIDVEEVHKQPDVFLTLKDSFLKAFKIMDRELRGTSIDCFCSGTTAVTLVKQGQDLIIGNVGDSRAVLGTRDKDNSLTAVQLTVDLKPSLPAEAERIRKHKGRVFALRDEPEIARVWLPNTDSPGLAMARAFGDFCLKDYGLISVPDVSYRQLTERDEFIILATDGIWDVLSNEEVVEIVGSAPARSSAAKLLVETAVQGWRTKYPTSKVDDCAVVCLFLNSHSDDISSAFNDNGKVKDHSSTARNGEDVEESLEESNEETSEQELGWKDWSSLEGVSRADTLLTLPRFDPEKEEDKTAAGGGTKTKTKTNKG
ncbi:PREDICTED: probable protein phosphatase 2C 33 [Ipomoea nil]|uniref:probable protein phosphatase 2C 33 n=1 Tax=Ipomoea nil TaxID=35883 RepID=UPI000901B826|nr:PREDICTED: probable protein phosphatase 2C 33 [Ipomoea nil]